MRREIEDDRRAKLRSFLIQQRARLTPADVELPETGRRRVTGLRREEVAELAGVSNDWYRWFESGRPIRVSPSFLARLADALRLSPSDRTALYHLALPELYSSDERNLLLAQLGALSPIEQGEDVAPVLHHIAAAKDAFFSRDASARSMVRSRIWQSWERSVRLGVDPWRPSVPPAAPSADALAERRESNRMLIDASSPILERVKTVLYESPFALIMSDSQCCILDMWGRHDILRHLSRIDLEPGGDLSEGVSGTNAVGSAVIDERPIQVLGAENFCEGGSDLTCTASPIRDPLTHAIIGVLDVTAKSRFIYPQMIGIVTQAALQIEEQLAEMTVVAS